MTKSILCRCDECKELFDDDLLVEMRYTGASTRIKYVSPCCHAGYNYIEE